MVPEVAPGWVPEDQVVTRAASLKKSVSFKFLLEPLPDIQAFRYKE